MSLSMVLKKKNHVTSSNNPVLLPWVANLANELYYWGQTKIRLGTKGTWTQRSLDRHSYVVMEWVTRLPSTQPKQVQAI